MLTLITDGITLAVENWETTAVIAGAVYGLAVAIAKATPTTKDDEIVRKSYNLFKILGVIVAARKGKR